jgi:hypothetical protein
MLSLLSGNAFPSNFCKYAKQAENRSKKFSKTRLCRRESAFLPFSPHQTEFRPTSPQQKNYGPEPRVNTLGPGLRTPATEQNPPKPRQERQSHPRDQKKTKDRFKGKRHVVVTVLALQPSRWSVFRWLCSAPTAHNSGTKRRHAYLFRLRARLRAATRPSVCCARSLSTVKAKVLGDGIKRPSLAQNRPVRGRVKAVAKSCAFARKPLRGP